MRLLAAVLMLLPPAMAIAQEAQKPPYWASIRASQARTRTGPARTYPVNWLYQRADLPVRVIGTFKQWRKVEDPDGAQGWMQATLLSQTRTALVRGAEPAAMLERPAAGARLLWRVAPGVVGRVSACADGWCRLEVKGRAGFVEAGALWGVETGESLP